VNQGHRTLGFHLTGDGTSSAHKKIMKTKAKEYSGAIISSSLQRGEISVAYKSYYMTSLSYGTAATSLNIKECEGIQRPVVNTILPKMGVNRNTARNVVFGTRKYDGLGLYHLGAVQGFAQLQYLIGSLRNQDTTGGGCIRCYRNTLNWNTAQPRRSWKWISQGRTNLQY
jgi:hypothetical protein